MTKDVEPFHNIETAIYDEIGSWSLIKLIILGYFVAIHTSIITSKNNIFENCIYVDLFAGSGINRVKLKTFNVDVEITGSSLVTVLAANGKYTEMIFSEIDKDYNKALRNRLEYIDNSDEFIEKRSKFNVLEPMDVNDAVPEIIKIINEYGPNTHSLIFIDPYGM